MGMRVCDNMLIWDGVDREVAEFPLEMRLPELRAEHTRKGGCGNAAIERIFALMTYLVAGKLKTYMVPNYKHV